jgi:hypothetical protein
MRTRLLSVSALLLTSCATVPAGADQDGVIWARLGQTVTVDGPRVTPIRVLEDSRCPMEARCVWAGQVRLQVRIRTGSGSTVREIVSNKPLPVADGTLELVSVMPPKSTQHPIRSRDYRFGFRFAGGL